MRKQSGFTLIELMIVV
ncbi:MAG: prepilin-type N-terminal cleavage/methylation domain-containing protein, partial [Candidatus Thiodiazotropha sp.]